MWPTAIKDLAESCKQNQALCENNLEIMLMLSEEIFDNSKSTMTKNQSEQLKDKYTENLIIIYDLCDFIAKTFIQDSSKISPSLIKTCLRTLYSFLNWAPAFFIFSRDFLDGIVVNLIQDPKLTVQCLQCLIETFNFNIKLSTISNEDLVQIRKRILDTLPLFIVKLQAIFPMQRNFREERIQKLASHNQLTLFDNVAKEVALVFIALFKNHFNWIFDTALSLYKTGNRQYLDVCMMIETAVKYMINLSNVDNDPLYKICIEFWQAFTNKKVEMDSTLC